MSSFNVKDKVRAAKDHGGWARERIDKGTEGLVVASPLWSTATVQWRVKTWTGSKMVMQEAHDDEMVRV